MISRRHLELSVHINLNKMELRKASKNPYEDWAKNKKKTKADKVDDVADKKGGQHWCCRHSILHPQFNL